MQLTITYTDPKTYTKPFAVTLPVFYQADDDLIENEVGPLGRWQVVLDGDDLKIKMSLDGAQLPLIPLSDTQFVFRALGGQVRFVAGDFPAMRKP